MFAQLSIFVALVLSCPYERGDLDTIPFEIDYHYRQIPKLLILMKCRRHYNANFIHFDASAEKFEEYLNLNQKGP